MEGYNGRGRTKGLVALLALESFSQYYRSHSKPPITAALIAANTLVYLRPSFLHSILPSIDQVWFNPHLILKHKSWKRFLLSPFYHVGEPHLFYNMLSLLWKGIQLESSMSSAEFASMVAALLAMSQGITIILAKSLLMLFDYDKPYFREYAAGFSGVLFAMKVVHNSSQFNGTFGTYSNVYGIAVPSRYAVWAELVLVQIFVPGVSFLGHLGGILAGIAYLRLKRSFSRPFSGLGGVLGWPMRVVREFFRWPRRRLFGRGRIGGGSPESLWRCRACTYDNYGLLVVCEMCGTARRSDEELDLPLPRSHPPLDELRRRRVERFGI